MSGDFSRQTFDPLKHYSGVLMQQGRVQLDADWNEQVAIQQYRTVTEATDVIGVCGVPKANDGFKIEITPDGHDLTIAAGRMYVDGLLCELEATPLPITFVPGSPEQVTVPTLMVDGQPLQPGQWIEIAADNIPAKLFQILVVDPEEGTLTLYDDITEYQSGVAPVARRVMTYTTQPDYPHPEFTGAPAEALLSPPSLPATLVLPDGTYVVFVDVWQRDITALDDPHLREVALGGPDTTTRLKTVWQVRLLPVETGITSPPLDSPPRAVVTCDTPFPEWDRYVAPRTGRLNARTKVAEDTQDPCILPPSAGYSRLENQLYRVEVQTGGSRDQATFKWSRDNASVVTIIEKITGGGYIVTVSDIGKDEVLGFAADQWAEIVDEAAELKGMPHPLVRITKIDPTTRELTLEQSIASLDGRLGLKLRRWDQTGNTATTNGVQMTADWLDLEGNIQVHFSAGTYRAGDYWLIPARTATGEIEWPPFDVPNTRPLAQPPVGIRHHYCRLALLEVHDGLLLSQDCRQLFPSLTTICAEDVCFDNSVCQLPGVETVQEALDRLCAAHDLRHHNKHLHGYGVVCGLKVRCAPHRGHVVIEKGYALDCEGYDIEVPSNRTFAVVQQAREHGLLNAQGTGEVCLTIARDGTIAVEAGTSQGFWQSVLEGTLLMDFYQECIESLWQFLVRQLWHDPADTKLVPDAQRRLTSLLNLLWELLNASSGPYVFLASSGASIPSPAPSPGWKEHEFLHQLYEDVRNRIASETFCAMFDDVQPFPDYPYQVPSAITTIFGPVFQFQQRLRVHPSGRFAYACGNGATIHVYDLTTHEMVQALTFPAGTNLDMQDVAFSSDGTALHAVGILNNQDSVFATATIGANHTHTWGPTTVVCDIKFVRLATTAAHPGNLYAIGKARGLYIFADPAHIPLTPTADVPFNATGLLRLPDNGNMAFAAEQTGSPVGTEAPNFNRVRAINLANPTAVPVVTYAVQGPDQDNDIAVSGNSVYITGDPAPTQVKTLWVFPIGGATTPPPTAINLGINTITRLATVPASPFLLITEADPCRVVRLDLRNNVLDQSFRIPVQIYPLDIVVSANGNAVYVLNMFSNTLSVISVPAVLSALPQPVFTDEPPTTLSNYRQDILDAYADLLGKFGQFLKDCFCDQFLVDCPECGPDDKVYLGCVEIRTEQVYNICNFTKRRYVKSFPTWEYWLSTVPILPLVKQALAKFCCTVL
jgi:DNA-binding beta-propeller fold protein YncE